MDIRFPVLWLRLWRSLAIYMLVAIALAVAAAFVVLTFKEGSAHGLRHVTPVGLLIGSVVVISLVGACSLMIALFYRTMAVRLTEEFIEGRDYWSRKKMIPLSDITGIAHFSQNGIQSIVISSSTHGSIHISSHTENLKHLLALLKTYEQRQKTA